MEGTWWKCCLLRWEWLVGVVVLSLVAAAAAAQELEWLLKISDILRYAC